MKILFNNFTNFNNIFKANQINQQRISRFTYPNLAPLPKDTVSFSGRSELVASDMSDAPTTHNCFKTEINAEPAAHYLEKVLEKYILPYTVKPKEKKAEKPLDATISTRIKGSTSIREKVVSKHGKLYKKEYKAFIGSFLDELSKNFELKKNIKEEDVQSCIKEILKNNDDTRYTPYSNVPFMVDSLLRMLHECAFIEVCDFDSSEYKNAMISMIDNVENSYVSQVLDENGDYIKPSTIAGIKYYANDIVGSRIILEDSNPRYIELVFEGLQRAVKDGLLKITSIENNIPDENNLPEGTDISDYQYATDKQLKDFARNTNAELITNVTKTGYISLHVNVDLSDEIFKSCYDGIFNGYTGEIQILGRDVERLKNIEDLCYKLKDNKSVYKRVYEPFQKHFVPLYREHAADFDEYTYRLYLAQRANSKKKKSTTFPPPSALGFTEEQIPPQLDFNRLAIKKQDCDQDSKLQDRSNEDKKNNLNNLYWSGNISTMKTIVRDKIYKQSQS